MRAVIAASLLLLLSTAVGAQPLPGNPADGRALAHRLCAECHVVADSQPRTSTDAVPTFASLARDPAITALSLNVFLQTPHAEMPNLMLSREEMDNLAAYILSLRR